MKLKKLHPVVIGLVLSTFFAACGSNPPPGTGGGSGSGGGTPSFQTSCTNRGGTLLPATSTRPEVCKFQQNLTASWFYGAYSNVPRWSSPRLNPGNYATATATYPMIELKPGDRVTFQGTGVWDKADGGGQCQNWRDLNGVISGSTSYEPPLPDPLAQPQGLLALDGNQVVFVGSSRTWTVQNQGVLYIGLNMNGPNSSYYCWSVTPTVFYATHCEDAQTTTHPCP